MANKTIFITGTSSGFGKLAVPRLLARGHTVVTGLRGGQARLEGLFAKELQAHPGRLSAVELHMERPETFEAARRAIADRHGGRLDVLVNNAGFGLLGAFEDQRPEQIRHQFEVNFFGPAEFTRALLPALRAARGRILNLSSIGGLVTFPYYGTYNATKHALESHTEGLYYELKPFGVQVGLIEPGAFRTEFSKGSMVFGDGAKSESSLYFKATRSLTAFLDKNYRMAGNPEAVARKIVRLCEKDRVPMRTIVGLDAHLMFLLRKFLPENLRVPVIEFVVRKLMLEGGPK